MDLLTRRVGDMELLVLILLGTSGLYAIVFVAVFLFQRHQLRPPGGPNHRPHSGSDRPGHGRPSRAAGRDGAAVEPNDGRAARRAAPAIPTRLGDPDRRNHRAPGRLARPPAQRTRPAGADAGRKHGGLSGSSRRLARPVPSLAGLYLGFGRIYASSDPARSRFYLERALRLATPESALASEIHYQLACRYAASHDFPHAMRELAAAFEHQFKTLEERLASDIEEGGKLYELASTAPFDKGRERPAAQHEHRHRLTDEAAR